MAEYITREDAIQAVIEGTPDRLGRTGDEATRSEMRTMALEALRKVAPANPCSNCPHLSISAVHGFAAPVINGGDSSWQITLVHSEGDKPSVETFTMGCGHPVTSVVSSGEGTSFCSQCAEAARIKVGDTVLIRKPANGHYLWVPAMDKFVGKEVVVSEVGDFEDHEFKAEGWWFLFEWGTRVSE